MLAVTSISALVVNANTSAVSILLPAMSKDVGTSTATLQWAVTGYSLVGAAVIVTGGVLGDIVGRRRVFIAALALFVLSCALIALSRNGAGVITGRCIQGAAGSTILACGMSLISVAKRGSDQVRAVSIWGAASAVGAAAGPLVGGALVDSTGWQGLFWIDAAIALACVPLTLRTVAESRDPKRPRSIDIAGMALIALTLVPFVLALTKGPDWGWGSPKTLVCLAVTVLACIGFFVVEGRVHVPLVDLKLLRNRVLVGSTLTILIVAGAINALMYVTSLYFQDPHGLHMSPLQAGLATLPAAAGIVVVAPFVSSLARSIGSRTVIGIGFVVATAGFAIMVFVTAGWTYGLFVLPLVLMAVGMGLSNGCASSAATASVPGNEVGAASGISNMARYVGAALMTAVVATLYATASTEPGVPAAEAVAHGVARSALFMAITSAAGIALALFYGRHRPRPAGSADRAAAAAGVGHTVPSHREPAEVGAGS